jgi:hypothetical protein
MAKNSKDLSEQEILALAISSEDSGRGSNDGNVLAALLRFPS